ncbi:hypothetical protein Pint_04641 [Pistacia integerrima]|uniref:Uncharacterized protein n=1 Tax=Pistacia integerrima TaxID=434235 RepID=A0ACC0Z4S0_9ROSI|nr:hypothetical protein Pint_04641 [Pistacia integerrima]
MASSKFHIECLHGLPSAISFLTFTSQTSLRRGHRVSFLLPRGALPKLQQLNHHPQLIHFFPLVIPHVDGFPPGAESASVMDKTRDQVETILSSLRPYIVFFDFGRWIPLITRQLGTKSINCSAVNAYSFAFLTSPGRRITLKTTLEERIRLPLAYPSTTVRIKRHEAPHIAGLNDTGAMPETPAAQLEEKWDKWLNKFQPDSVMYCAFGNQITLQKEQFQEMMLGFELSGPPEGCSTIEEALPEGV